MRKETARGGWRELVELMRPPHWGKNLLVLAPLFFSGAFFGGETLAALAGALGFCLASSGVYALNDCFDAPQDRLHPRKKNRPVASGRVSPAKAGALAAALFALSLLLPPLVSLLFPGALEPARALRGAILIAVYAAMNVAYSALGLKRMPIADVTIVAFGFVLRVLAGSALTGIAVSRWLLLTVLTASYYMSFGKRRSELRGAREGDVRHVLRFYTDAFLTNNQNVFLTMTLVFYSLWSVDAQTAARYGDLAVLSVPLVILILLFYSLDLETSQDGDPVELLRRDKRLLVLAALYAALMAALIYIGGGRA